MIGKATLILFQLFIISLLFGQLSRLPLPGVVGAVYLNDFILILLVGLWLIWKGVIKKKFEFGQIDYAIALFIAVTFISLIFSLRWVSSDMFIVGLSYWVRITLYLSLFRISKDLYENFDYKPWNLFAIIGLLFALIGLVQFVVFPDFSQYVQHGWDPHYYRVLSSFFDPNFAGLFLIFSFYLYLQRFYHSYETNQHSLFFFNGVSLLIVGLAILLTFSRSTYLALIIGMFVFAWFKDKRLILAMLLVGLLAFFTIPRLQERVIGAITIDETARLRLVDYERTWKIVEDNTLLGVGFNTFRYAQDSYGYFRDSRGVNNAGGHAGAGADSSFLFILATAGVLGLVTVLYLLFVLGNVALLSTHTALLLSCLVALVVHTQFVNSLFYTWIISWVMIVFGAHGVDKSKTK